MSKANAGNLDIETPLQGDAEDVDSSNSFFDDLERQVNGQVIDEPDQSNHMETEQVTQEAGPADTSDGGNDDLRSELDTLKKRYSDSSKEAQRLKGELDVASKYTKYKPLIDHLNNDPTSVEALKNHLSGKTEPQFAEDFVFDAHEAVTKPDSESGKALRQLIDSEAERKVQTRLMDLRKEGEQNVQQERLMNEIDRFKQEKNMSDDDFNKMQEWSQSRDLTLDDIYYLMNKGAVADNVANQTKQDMIRQMDTLKSMPQSASNANSAPENKDYADKVFDVLQSLDDGADNLFS